MQHHTVSLTHCIDRVQKVILTVLYCTCHILGIRPTQGELRFNSKKLTSVNGLETKNLSHKNTLQNRHPPAFLLASSRPSNHTIRARIFVCLTRASTWRNDASADRARSRASAGTKSKKSRPFTCPRLAEVLKTTSANPHPAYTEHSI